MAGRDLGPLPELRALSGASIVCVGFAEWQTELWTNQHHLMARLAATGCRILFVESLGLRRPTLAGRDVRRMARRVRTGLQPPRRLDGVEVLSPLVLPLHGDPRVRALNARLLPALVGRAARRARLAPRPILWAYVPQAEALLDALDPSLVVYHCVDDIAAQEGIDEASFRAAEERFVARADLVLASAPPLWERMRAMGARRVLEAPNVADVDRFATALQDGPVDAALDALPRPRVVFTGAIAAKKLDLELLRELAMARPERTLALVGPVGLGDPHTDVTALEALPNVHLLGHRDLEALPAVLRGADVAIIPYRRSRLTDSIFPMKVFEYLAAGLPVVATAMPSLAGVPDVVRAEDPRAFLEAVDAALLDDDRAARAARSARARGRSWAARLQEIDAAVGALR
jgi:glycosyltransferase involved in cell wall biosynthesis